MMMCTASIQMVALLMTWVQIHGLRVGKVLRVVVLQLRHLTVPISLTYSYDAAAGTLTVYVV